MCLKYDAKGNLQSIIAAHVDDCLLSPDPKDLDEMIEIIKSISDCPEVHFLTPGNPVKYLGKNLSTSVKGDIFVDLCDYVEKESFYKSQRLEEQLL